MEEVNANLSLLYYSEADNYFPDVKDYVDGHIKMVKLLKSEQIVYKRKIEIGENFNIKVEKNSDIIFGLELIGKSDDIYGDINSIELIIGGITICFFYLSELYVMENDGLFLIKLNFDKIFMNYTFFPIIAVNYGEILFKINGYELQNLEMKCYLTEGLLENELRGNCVNINHDILMNHYERYNIVMNGNRIYMNFGDNIFSKNNFIKSLRFQFTNPVDFNSITIYGNNMSLTTITKYDLDWVSSREFLLTKFNYKTFLYNKIIIEFDKNIDNNYLSLTTTNFNKLIIYSGLVVLRHLGLRREINCVINIADYIEISDELYNEKVLPKEDKICAISHEDFEENEERIICGRCFTSYKREVIDRWFYQNREKICPYGRCISYVWFKRS